MLLLHKRDHDSNGLRLKDSVFSELLGKSFQRVMFKEWIFLNTRILARNTCKWNILTIPKLDK